MTAEKLANAILKKCDIYYGDALISKEAIIEKYLEANPSKWDFLSDCENLIPQT